MKNMMMTMAVLGMVTAFATTAMATNNNGDVTVTSSGGNALNSNTITVDGGAGGNGGSVTGSGNSTNTVKNTVDNNNNVTNAQAQAQKQKQNQSQSSVNTNRNNNTNNNTNVSGSVSGVGNSGNSSITWQDQRNPVSTATAPALASGQDTCMGSSSAGGQGMSFGLSLGSTWTDEECVRRKNAAFLNTLGRADLALAIVAQSPSVAAAIDAVGSPSDKAVLAKVRKNKKDKHDAQTAETKALYNR